MKKNTFSWVGFILGGLTLVAAICGGRVAAIVYDDPPKPLLEHAEGRPVTSGDVADAVVDKAADLKDELKEKSRDLAKRGYRRGRRLIDRYLDGEEKAATPADGRDAEEKSEIVGERTRRLGFRERFRVNLSSLSDRQKSLLRVLYDFSLFGGCLGLLAGVIGWVRREDGRLALAAVMLGAGAALWANVVMTLTWLLDSAL